MKLLVTLIISLMVLMMISCSFSSVLNIETSNQQQQLQQLIDGDIRYDLVCNVEYTSSGNCETTYGNNHTISCPSTNQCLSYSKSTQPISIRIRLNGDLYYSCPGEIVSSQLTFNTITIESYYKNNYVNFYCPEKFLGFYSTQPKVSINLRGINIYSNSETYSNVHLSAITVSSPYGSKLSLERSSINGFQSYNSGGAINAVGFYVVLNETTIQNCVSNYNGGAVYSDEQILVYSSTLTNNTATEFGGAFYAPQVEIYNASIISSNSAYNSGAIHSNITIINDSTLESNYASDQGGVSYMQEGSVLFSSHNSFFSYNKAGYLAGVISIPSSVQFEAIGSIFSGNNAQRAGVINTYRVSPFDNDNFVLNLTGSYFNTNSATDYDSGDCVDMVDSFISIVGGFYYIDATQVKPFTPSQFNNLDFVSIYESFECPASHPVIIGNAYPQCGGSGYCDGVATLDSYGIVSICNPYNDGSGNNHRESKVAGLIFSITVGIFAIIFFFGIAIRGFKDAVSN